MIWADVWLVAFEVAYFNSLEIDAPDAATLFDLLDYDKSGEIDIEEGSYSSKSSNLHQFIRELDGHRMNYISTWILQGCEICAP